MAFSFADQDEETEITPQPEAESDYWGSRPGFDAADLIDAPWRAIKEVGSSLLTNLDRPGAAVRTFLDKGDFGAAGDAFLDPESGTSATDLRRKYLFGDMNQGEGFDLGDVADFAADFGVGLIDPLTPLSAGLTSAGKNVTKAGQGLYKGLKTAAQTGDEITQAVRGYGAARNAARELEVLQRAGQIADPTIMGARQTALRESEDALSRYGLRDSVVGNPTDNLDDLGRELGSNQNARLRDDAVSLFNKETAGKATPLQPGVMPDENFTGLEKTFLGRMKTGQEGLSYFGKEIPLSGRAATAVGAVLNPIEMIMKTFGDTAAGRGISEWAGKLGAYIYNPSTRGLSGLALREAEANAMGHINRINDGYFRPAETAMQKAALDEDEIGMVNRLAAKTSGELDETGVAKAAPEFGGSARYEGEQINPRRKEYEDLVVEINKRTPEKRAAMFAASAQIRKGMDEALVVGQKIDPEFKILGQDLKDAAKSAITSEVDALDRLLQAKERQPIGPSINEVVRQKQETYFDKIQKYRDLIEEKRVSPEQPLLRDLEERAAVIRKAIATKPDKDTLRKLRSEERELVAKIKEGVRVVPGSDADPVRALQERRAFEGNNAIDPNDADQIEWAQATDELEALPQNKTLREKLEAQVKELDEEAQRLVSLGVMTQEQYDQGKKIGLIGRAKQAPTEVAGVSPKPASGTSEPVVKESLTPRVEGENPVGRPRKVETDAVSLDRDMGGVSFKDAAAAGEREVVDLDEALALGKSSPDEVAILKQHPELFKYASENKIFERAVEDEDLVLKELETYFKAKGMDADGALDHALDWLDAAKKLDDEVSQAGPRFTGSVQEAQERVAANIQSAEARRAEAKAVAEAKVAADAAVEPVVVSNTPLTQRVFGKKFDGKLPTDVDALQDAYNKIQTLVAEFGEEEVKDLIGYISEATEKAQTVDRFNQLRNQYVNTFQKINETGRADIAMLTDAEAKVSNKIQELEGRMRGRSVAGAIEDIRKAEKEYLAELNKAGEVGIRAEDQAWNKEIKKAAAEWGKATDLRTAAERKAAMVEKYVPTQNEIERAEAAFVNKKDLSSAPVQSIQKERMRADGVPMSQEERIAEMKRGGTTPGKTDPTTIPEAIKYMFRPDALAELKVQKFANEDPIKNAMAYLYGPFRKVITNAELTRNMKTIFNGVDESAWSKIKGLAGALNEEGKSAHTWDELRSMFKKETGGAELDGMLDPKIIDAIKSGEIKPADALKPMADPNGWAKIDSFGGKSVFLPQEAARRYTNYVNASTAQLPAFLETVLAPMAALTKAWKFGATRAWPSYHIRNIIGDSFRMMQEGSLTPASSADMARLGGVLSMNAADISKNGYQGYKAFDEVLVDVGQGAAHFGGRQQIPASEVMKMAEQQGIINTGVTREMIDKSKGSAKKGYIESMIEKAEPVGRSLDYMKGLAESREDIMRTADFIERLRQGADPLEAGLRTTETLYNFADTSPAVKFMSKYGIAPFAAWTAKNVPAQVEYAVRNPGMFAAMLKGAELLKGQDGENTVPESALPAYLKDKYNLVLSKGRNPDTGRMEYQYITTNGVIPMDDITQLWDTHGASLLDSLGPVLQTAGRAAWGDEDDRTGEAIARNLIGKPFSVLKDVKDQLQTGGSGQVKQGVSYNAGEVVAKQFMPFAVKKLDAEREFDRAERKLQREINDAKGRVTSATNELNRQQLIPGRDPGQFQKLEADVQQAAMQYQVIQRRVEREKKEVERARVQLERAKRAP